MNMVVRQLPPRESWRIRVILLSRYGTWVFCRETEEKEREERERVEGEIEREREIVQGERER